MEVLYGGTEKSHEKRQDNPRSGRDSKEKLPEYKSRALPLQHPMLDYNPTALRDNFLNCVSHVEHDKKKKQFEEMRNKLVAAHFMVLP
jgi:hypothetical protein